MWNFQFGGVDDKVVDIDYVDVNCAVDVVAVVVAMGRRRYLFLNFLEGVEQFAGRKGCCDFNADVYKVVWRAEALWMTVDRWGKTSGFEVGQAENTGDRPGNSPEAVANV